MCRQRTDAASIQWPHVEDVNTLHLSQNFETLQTGGLLDIGGNGTGLGTRGKKVGLSLDLYTWTWLAIGVFFDLVAAIGSQLGSADMGPPGSQNVRSSFLKPSTTLGELAE